MGNAIGSVKSAFNDGETKVWRADFNSAGQPVKQFAPYTNTQGRRDLATITEYYPGSPRPKKSTDPTGHETKYYYNKTGLEMSQVTNSPSGSGISWVTIRKTIKGNTLWKEINGDLPERCKLAV